MYMCHLLPQSSMRFWFHSYSLVLGSWPTSTGQNLSCSRVWCFSWWPSRFQLQPRRTPVRCQKSRPGVSHHQPLGAWVHPKVHLGICKDKLWNFIKPQINLVGTDRTIYPTFTGPRGLKSQWLPGHVLIRKTMFLATRIQTSNIGGLDPSRTLPTLQSPALKQSWRYFMLYCFVWCLTCNVAVGSVLNTCVNIYIYIIIYTHAV